MKRVYGIYDVKMGHYLDPMFCENSEVAERSFYNVLAKVDTMGAHAQDYDLRYIGSFDEDSGLLSAIDNHIHVINGLQLVNKYRSLFEDQQNEVSYDTSIQPSSEG